MIIHGQANQVCLSLFLRVGSSSDRGERHAGQNHLLGCLPHRGHSVGAGRKWDNSPRVMSKIADAIQLADRIYQRMKADFKLEGTGHRT